MKNLVKITILSLILVLTSLSSQAAFNNSSFGRLEKHINSGSFVTTVNISAPANTNYVNFWIWGETSTRGGITALNKATSFVEIKNGGSTVHWDAAWQGGSAPSSSGGRLSRGFSNGGTFSGSSITGFRLGLDIEAFSSTTGAYAACHWSWF